MLTLIFQNFLVDYIKSIYLSLDIYLRIIQRKVGFEFEVDTLVSSKRKHIGTEIAPRLPITT